VPNSSELAVPVKKGDTAIAVINVESERPDAFTVEDSHLIEIIAEYVSSAIDRVRKSEDEARYLSRLEALHEHASRLAQARELEAISTVTLDILEKVLGYGFVSFQIVGNGVLRTLGTIGRPSLDMPLPLDGRGVTAKAAREARSILLDDVRLDPDFIKGSTDSLSELAVPAFADEQAVAVLNVESEELSAFNESDRKLLETLAMHVASAIERLRHEELLKESEERYSSYLESSRDAVFVIVEGKYAYINQRLVDLLGYSSKEEVMQTLPIDHVAPEDRPRALSMITERPKGIEHPDLYEIGLILRDGSIIYVENHVSLIDFEEKPATLVITRDVSDRRDYETKLEALHDHSTRLATADSIDEIEEISRQTLTSLFGIERGNFALVDQDLLHVRYRWNIENPTPFVMPLDGSGITVRAANTGESQLVDDVTSDPDYYTRMPNRTNITLSELAVPVKSGDDVIAIINIESTELAAFTRDHQRLTEIFAEHVASALERIQSQDAIDAMREAHHNELIRGIQRVSSLVRHDLRGPMQTIMNAAYLMKNDPEKVEEMIGVIEGSVNHASGVMDDWRNQGILEGLDLSDVDLGALVNNALDNIIIPPNIEVSMDLEPITLLLDRIKMMRTLDNLIRNAVEAMPDGGTLTISTSKQGSTVNLEVSDTGEGISETALRNLFQPFYTTKASGMGLGLVYCKRAVEAHRGEINADSTRGQGTTFSVALPLHREN